MIKVCLIVMLVLSAVGLVFAANVYVDANLTTGANDGSTWANAFQGSNGLVLGIAAGTGNTIYVAEGTYLPTNTGDPTVSFIPGAGTTIMGGYDTSSLQYGRAPARDPWAYETILDGDLNDDDAVVPDLFENPTALAEQYSTSMVENTDLVVKMPNDGAVLDGFVVKHGNSFPGSVAGIGLYSNSTVRNCRITECAGGGGAAIDVSTSVGIAVIENCVITRNTNGQVGIIQSTGGEVTFRNCVVSENSATGPDGDGSGIYIRTPVNSNFHVYDSVFERNTSVSDFLGSYGRQGPITVRGGNDSVSVNMDIHNCVIRNNRCSIGAGNGSGGAVTIHGAGLPVVTEGILENCLIADNAGPERASQIPPSVTEAGTGITVRRAARAVVSNCTVVNNSAKTKPGIGAGISLFTNDGGDGGAALVLKNSIVWGNTGPDVMKQLDSTVTMTYSCIDDGGDDPADPNNIHTGTGVITTNPQFVANDPYYRLQSTSPCINTGDPASDYNKEPKCNGERVDMGAWGNTGQATPKVAAKNNAAGGDLYGDVNCSGGVDLADFAKMASEWLQ